MLMSQWNETFPVNHQEKKQRKKPKRININAVCVIIFV